MAVSGQTHTIARSGARGNVLRGHALGSPMRWRNKNSGGKPPHSKGTALWK